MLVNFKPPNWEIISTEEIIGITVIILAFWYGEDEFMRIGYYINNEWTEEKIGSMGKLFVIKSEPIIRAILSDQPRITNYPCYFEGQ